MTVLSLILALCGAGLILWAINAYLPIPQPIKNVAMCVVAVLVGLWLLNASGLISLDTRIGFLPGLLNSIPRHG